MADRFSIDFGTTNSVVARWTEGGQETVPLPGLSLRHGDQHLVPSLLYVRDGRTADVLIGAAVKAGGFDRLSDNRLFRNFKRGLGASSSAPEPRLIDGVPWSDADAGEHFLRRLLAALPVEPAAIDQLVITVPVAAFEGYASWLKSALAGFPPDRIRVVDESTAAALGYSVTEPGATVLVSDFGGGTLDLSLVRLPELGAPAGSGLGSLLGDGVRPGAARVIAKVGRTLGGSDVDRWLLADLLESLDGLSVDAAGDPALLAACETAKISLSTEQSVEIDLALPDGVRHSLPFTRARLEELMERHGFYAALRHELDRLLGTAHRHGVFKEDIGHVLLVGGTSLIPSVQRTFDTYFRAVTHGRRKISLPTWPALHWTVENTTIRVDKPFTAVVEGALQIAAGLGLQDRLTHSYGLRVFDPLSRQPRYEELIPAGSTYPSAPVTVKLAASSPRQATLDLVIAQIDAGAASGIEVKYEAGQPIFLSQPAPETRAIVPLGAGRPVRLPLDPPGTPGKARLSATFYVDRSRRLCLTVVDLKTRATLLDHSADLTPAASVPSAGLSGGAETPAALSALPALADAGTGAGHRLSFRDLASALKLLPPAQVSTQALSAALRSTDSLVRYGAAELLGRRGDREARLVMQDILQCGTPPQRASAVQHLYRFSWFAAEALFRQALQDPDPRVREGAILALCKMRAPEAYRLVVEILISPIATDGLRKSAAWGAWTNPDPAAVPVMVLALEAADPEIRAQALEVLGACGSLDAIPAVRAALVDPDPDVKYAAALSWVELAGEACFAELAGMIGSAAGDGRLALLRGLFHATNYLGLDVALSPQAVAVVTALQAAAQDELPSVRIAAGMHLAWIRHPLAEQALSAAFHRETNPDVKAHLLTSAVQLSSPVAPGLLDAARADPALLVRQTADYLNPSSS